MVVDEESLEMSQNPHQIWWEEGVGSVACYGQESCLCRPTMVEVPPWLTTMLSKGSYGDPKVKDERVGRACTIGRVEWDEEKHVDEDLQTLDPKPSFRRQ